MQSVLGVIEPGGDIVDRAFGQGQDPVPVGGVARGRALGSAQQRGIGRVEQRPERLEGALDGDPDVPIRRMQRGHPSALGVERQLLDPRTDGDQVRGVDPTLGGEGE